jgi:hypothetical protein
MQLSHPDHLVIPTHPTPRSDEESACPCGESAFTKPLVILRARACHRGPKDLARIFSTPAVKTLSPAGAKDRSPRRKPWVTNQFPHAPHGCPILVALFATGWGFVLLESPNPTASQPSQPPCHSDPSDAAQRRGICFCSTTLVILSEAKDLCTCPCGADTPVRRL